jgi:DNA-binding MarR family transcriptional regulator
MHLVLSVLTAARAIENAAARVFKPHGLTLARFNVLTLLSRNADGMRASDLASALIVDPSNVTGLLKRMMLEGLLLEIENEKDRRQYIVGMSPKGRAVWQKANLDYEKYLELLLAPLPPAGLALAIDVLGQLEDGAAKLP